MYDCFYYIDNKILKVSIDKNEKIVDKILEFQKLENFVENFVIKTNLF